MHRFSLTRPYPCHPVGRGVLMKHLAAQIIRQIAAASSENPSTAMIPVGETVLILLQEIEHAAVHLVIDRGLDGEDIDLLID